MPLRLFVGAQKQSSNKINLKEADGELKLIAHTCISHFQQALDKLKRK